MPIFRANAWPFLLACSVPLFASGCLASERVGDDAAVVDAALDGAVTSPVVDSGPPVIHSGPCEVAPGTRRQGERRCGFCGVHEEVCTNGVWQVDFNACRGAGECVPGTSETRVRDYCGVESRSCATWCNWNPWMLVTPDTGTCVRGTTRVRPDVSCGEGVHAFDVCTDLCEERGPTACGGGCAGDPRTSPDWAEETCVPGGELMRQTSSGYEEWSSVIVSPYFIDRYPVTYRRYQTCVAAGGCTPLSPFYSSSFGITIRDVPEHPDAPVWTASFEQARAFCAWDGGRRLPTAAQHHFAAAGASGHDNLFTSCLYDAQHPTDHCDSNKRLELGRIYDRYDDFPASTQPGFEVRRLTGSFFEWIDEWLVPPAPHAAETSPLTYPTTGPRRDPTGPSSGSLRAVRGRSRQAVHRPQFRDDDYVSQTWPEQRAEFRCARPTTLEINTP